MSSLGELFTSCGSDKEWRHHYGAIYEWLLADIRDKSGLRFLEVGVRRGASLRAWEQYLPTAEIVGVDIDPSCASLELERARVVIGNAAQRTTLAGLGEFDVIVDDGSHRPGEQLATFAIMWPRTRHLYVIEDISWRRAKPRFRLVDAVFARLRGESQLWGPRTRASCWTIFAKELVAFKRLPK